MTPAVWTSICTLAFSFAVFAGGAIWNLAKLSQRVKTLEDNSDGSQSTRERVIVLETKLDGFMAQHKDASDHQARTMDGMARQLATIAADKMAYKGPGR